MRPGNRTIARDSVLRPTGDSAAAPTSLRQGLSPTPPPSRQTALWLADAEVQWLDDRVRDIRQGGWRNITRSAVLRALLQALMDYDLALTGVTGEAELADHIRRALTTPRP